ncbi:MAG: 2-dehydro-3-deoxygalactonokinase [Proteobacteria bacterium]|nr:2-dehydro-3-deoxygalactonokinase [Pseudomonadota bacterium]
MIGVAWGRTGFRAWRIGGDGRVRDRRAGARGLLSVPDGRFSDTLREELGRWIAGGEDRILIAGPAWSMAGGAQGFRIPRPRPCPTPCGVEELAAALADVPFDWARVRLVPGVRDPRSGGETLNGEETHLLGAAAAIGGSGTLCLPGPMSCWAQMDAGRIAALSCHLTGEAFAALRAALLGRPVREQAPDPAAFGRGLTLSHAPGGMLSGLARLRAAAARPGAAEGAEGAALAAELLGLLVGAEVNTAMPPRAEVHLVGESEHLALYAQAIRALGGAALPPVPDTMLAGLTALGGAARWD